MVNDLGINDLISSFGLSFNLQETTSHLVKLALAYVLALPIGWNREQEERSAGIRTFPLVAMAACGFVTIAVQVLGADSAEQAKVMEGLITGVGFIGGGAILKQGDRAMGTATAASLWATGALGVAVGYGLVDIAVILSLVTYAALRFLSPLKTVARDGVAPETDLTTQAAGRDAKLRPKGPAKGGGGAEAGAQGDLG